MAGPWEKYASSQPKQGPWSKYAPQERPQATVQPVAASPVPVGGGDEFSAGIDVSTPKGQAQSEAAKQRFMALGTEAIDRLTPLGSVKEIAGQLSGSRPSSGLNAGLAAADIASLGLAGKLKAGAGLGELGFKGIKQALASGAGAGAASMGAEKMGAPTWLQAALGLAGGVGGGMAAGAQMGSKPALSSAAQSLQNAGGELTPAMTANSRTGLGLTGAMETSARTNPLLKGKYAGIDEKNANAVRKLAQGSFGNDILEPRGEAAGQNLKSILKSIATKRGEAYAPAVEALANSKGYPQFSKNILEAAESAAGDVSTVSQEAFSKALAKEMQGKTTPAQIDKALTSVKARFKSELAPGVAMDSQVNRDFKVMMGAVKDKFYEGMDNLSSNTPGLKGNLGQMVREAKGDYAEASQAMEPMAKLLVSRRGKPEAIGSGLLQSGSANLSALLKQADPQTAQNLKLELAKSIIGEAMGVEGISAAKLKTLLNVKYKDVAPLLGDELGALTRLQDSMALSRMQNLSTLNPSGSGRTAAEIFQIGSAPMALFNPMALKALAGKMALDAGYAYGGNAVQKGAQALGRMPDTALVGTAGALSRDLNRPKATLRQALQQ